MIPFDANLLERLDLLYNWSQQHFVHPNERMAKVQEGVADQRKAVRYRSKHKVHLSESNQPKTKR